MSSPATAESIIDRVARRAPHVVELAELLGPAARIESALLRRLRIELLPDLPAAVEAELWFSPLVQAHSADGLALSVPIAVVFRERLARQWPTGRRELLERARKIYTDVHAYLPPPLRLEEEVAWSLVAGDAAAVEAQLTAAVAALLAEPDRFRFWAGQAAARLPDGVAATMSGLRLTQAATGGELLGPGWEAAYRALATRPLAVRHIGPQLELGGPAGPGCRSITVPATAEVPLQVRWPAAGGATERVTVDPRADAPPVLVWGSGPAEVRTAAGVSYLVRDDPFQRSCRVDPAVDPIGELRSMLASPSIPGLRLAENDEAADIGMVSLDGRLALVDAGGRPFPAVSRFDPQESGFALSAVGAAAHLSRWLAIAELRSGSPLLAGAIEVTVAGVGAERGQNIDLAPTGQATVTVANLGPEPLFVAVLAISSDWSVDVVIWDRAAAGLPSGGEYSSGQVRLDVLGPEDEGFVRLVGVAARRPFDPSPLLLPAIVHATLPAPASSRSTSTSTSWSSLSPGTPTLESEFELMTGAPVTSPVPRYLEWTTSEALVRVRRPAADAGPVPDQMVVAHQGPVYALAFSPDGTRLATGCGDGSARVFAPVTGTELARLDHGGEVYAVAFSPDGTRLATGCGDGSVRVFAPVTGTELARLDHGGEVHAVAFSPDGRLVASAGLGESVRLWDAATGRTYSIARSVPASSRAVAFSPDGTLMASAGRDGTVPLWDVARGSLRGVLKGDPDVVTVLSVSPDDILLTSAERSWPSGLWETVAGKSRSALRGDSSVVAFSPDGTLVAAAGHDGPVRLWDIATGRPRATLRGHTRMADVVKFSPDGTLLASAGQDGTLRLWQAASWLETEPDEPLGTPADRGILIVAAAPPGLPPLASLEAGADLLADQLASRGLDVVRVTGEAATGTRVREIMADLRRQAADGHVADLLVLYVAGHSTLAVSGPEVVLADGARISVEEFAAVFGAARSSVVILDTNPNPNADADAMDVLDRAFSAASSPDRSIALLSSPGAEPSPGDGGFAEAFVAALARTAVIDSSLEIALNDRLAIGADRQHAVMRCFGSPISLPPMTAIPLSSQHLAEKLTAREDLIGARDLYQSTYDTGRRILGPDHADTLVSGSRLARSLRAVGDYQAARELDQDTLARRRRVLGEDDPRTLVSASNLARDLRALRDYQAARELDQDTLARRRRVLGEDDPRTLLSARRLARDLRALGDLQAARELDERIEPSQGRTRREGGTGKPSLRPTGYAGTGHEGPEVG